MSKRSDIKPFIVMDVLAEAEAREARGQSIIHMEVGQPSAPVPPNVIEATQSALAKGRVAYTQALGKPALRLAIAGHYESSHGTHLDPERVAVTTASSASFTLTFLGAFEAGARIGMVRPYYPAYPNILKALGLETVFIPCGEGYGLDMNAVEAAMKAGLDGLLIASPANPTGTVIPGEDLDALSALAAKHGVRIISDEIYHGITYGAPAPTMLGRSEDAIIINSFSKYFCMAGWRLGWMVMPPDLIRTMERLAQNLMISPPTLSQAAGLEALSPASKPYYDGIVESYRASHNLLLERLPKLGFTELSPAHGAFYVYANCARFGMASDTLCARLMDEAGIAITPGGDFDNENGQNTVRFSFAGSHDDIVEGVKRLEGWVGRLDQKAAL